MLYNERSVQELFWAIEDKCFDMEMTMSDAILENDPEYAYLCDLMNRYDAGDRSLKLYNEMRGVYALAS